MPLRKWFIEIWLITDHKKGVASTQLAKDLKITQKSAWFVLHRLHMRPARSSLQRPLKGMWRSMEHANKRQLLGRGAVGKAVVLGAVERQGRVIARVVRGTDTETMEDFVDSALSPGVTSISTDEHARYRRLHMKYPHGFVRHGQKENVSGDFHTQTIDGYWSQLKRQIIGIQHWVSAKHLDRYVAES